MSDADTSGEAFLLKDKILRVEDIFIKLFYYQAEIGKQLDRVLLVLKIYLSEVEYERLQCFRLKTLLSELLLMSLDYLFSLIVFITFWPLDMERITDFNLPIGSITDNLTSYSLRSSMIRNASVETSTGSGTS
jgi:hypothetical protein